MPTDSIPRLYLGDNVLYPLPLRTGGVLLIDAGPDIAADAATGQEDTWTSLGAQLAAHNIEVSDVRYALVTHAHLDHAGLAYRWAEAGATVLAGAADLPAIALGQLSRERQRDRQLADLRRHGCPPDIIEGMRSPRGRHPAGLRWEPCPPDALQEAAAAYELADGQTLQVIAAPGHTPGNLVAFIPERGELFSGDTILPTSVTTVPTPGMHYPAAVEGDEDAPRWPSLPPFMTSVATLGALPVQRIHPGHGETVDEPSKLFARFEEHHARRARRVRAALEDGPLSAYGVARRMFPRIPPRRFGQAMTEVLGHLDLLAAAGKLEFVEVGDAVEARLS